MKHYYQTAATIIAIIALIITSANAQQDTCKKISISNPHGLDMEISKVWVLDTVNFSVESVKALPFNLGATESFDIKVCVLARDGKSHSTQVRYRNTHGTSSYNVTMIAPDGTSSVKNVENKNYNLVVASNPATTHFTIQFPQKPIKDVTIELYSMDGSLVHVKNVSEITTGEVSVNVQGLSSGTYVTVVKIKGENIITKRIAIQH